MKELFVEDNINYYSIIYGLPLLIKYNSIIEWACRLVITSPEILLEFINSLASKPMLTIDIDMVETTQFTKNN